MTDEEKRLLQEDLQNAGSIAALLKKMADSQSREFRLLRQQIEEGPDHPSREELYDYVLGWMDGEASHHVMDHLILCRKCLEEVIRIRNIEETLATDTLNRADKVSLYSRIKDYWANLSLPVYVFPALEYERGPESDRQTTSFECGSEIVLGSKPADDGYLTIFHGCAATGKVELLFPLETKYASPVSGGQEIWPTTRTVQGPPGKHWFTVFWTRVPVIDPAAYQLEDADERERASADFFEALEDLKEEDVAAGTQEYMVIME